MSSGIVIHVVAGETKHTEVMVSSLIRIGTSADCDLRIDLPHRSFDSAVVLELTLSNGSYQVSSYDEELGITLNRTPLSLKAEIQDGDLIKFSSSDLELQFFPIEPTSALLASSSSSRSREDLVAPFIEQAALESAATARRDDAKVFLREFTRELVREINPSTKILAFLLTLTLVGGVLYLGFAAFRELQRSRRLMDAQNQQIKNLQDVLAGTNSQIKGIELSTDNVIKSLSLGANLRNLFGDGVCLISGTYIWVEAGTNRPLRHMESSAVEDGTIVDDPTKSSSDLTPEGNGARAEYEVNGTGFHVGGGYVLTNRHVVQPWTADERSLALQQHCQRSTQID
ncbi:MAG: FHA domain-containing protein [Pyrinomonadaceae bacterium]